MEDPQKLQELREFLSSMSPEAFKLLQKETFDEGCKRFESRMDNPLPSIQSMRAYTKPV